MHAKNGERERCILLYFTLPSLQNTAADSALASNKGIGSGHVDGLY